MINAIAEMCPELKEVYFAHLPYPGFGGYEAGYEQSPEELRSLLLSLDSYWANVSSYYFVL